MIIAIDGPAGSGKSTVAKKVAEKLGFLYVDTGAMYRALTLKIIDMGVNFEDKEKVYQVALNTDIQFRQEGERLRIFLDGKEVSYKIREPYVTNKVFYVADNVKVREVMVQLQRKLGEAGDSVFEGRDMTTVVFPNTPFKFFLDADFEERVRRRYKELKDKGMDVNYEEIKEDLRQRDIKDTTRPVGALKLAPDAVHIDTTTLTIDKVVEEICKRIKK